MAYRALQSPGSARAVMLKFLMKRALLSLITLAVLSIFVFLGGQLLPGDVGRAVLGPLAHLPRPGCPVRGRCTAQLVEARDARLRAGRAARYRGRRLGRTARRALERSQHRAARTVARHRAGIHLLDRVDPDLRSLAALAADVGGLARGGGAPDPDPLSDPALATAGADLFRLHRPR